MNSLCSQGISLSHFRQEKTGQATTFNQTTGDKTILIPRGERVTVCQAQGCGVITNLWITFPGWFWQHWNPAAPVSPTLLKTLILRLFWDRSPKPAVQVPVGDFFGNGLCESVSYAGKYIGISSGGFYCKFPMPFREGFRMELENLDRDSDTEVYANILYQLLENPDELEDDGYFHAQFNTGTNPGHLPMLVAEAAGRGHYVGCTVAAQGKDRGYLCYLEAPEHVYIDQDWETPRFTGTGMEDYFLGGWYFRDGTFCGPLHGLTSKDALNSSVAMYRVHEADAIHFLEHFRLEFINPWKAEDLWEFAHSSASFLYLDSPAGQQEALPPVDRLLCWYRIKATDHLSIP